MRRKVILTLTAGEPQGLQDFTRLLTLLASDLRGCELTAHDADGTLLFDGAVDFVQLNMLPSRPYLDLTIDAKHLISCGSSRAMDVPVENAGTSYTHRNLWQEGDPKNVAAHTGIWIPRTLPEQSQRPCQCWSTGDFKWVHGCKLHPGEHIT